MAENLTNPDEFPSGCLVTNSDWDILQVNEYVVETLGWPRQDLIGRPLSDILSKASRLFCQSYVLPIVLKEMRCDEIQLTVCKFENHESHVPIVVNARIAKDGSEHIFWNFFTAYERDKLYQELLDTRDRLETLNEKLEDLARTDELTKLLNRRELERRASVEFERAKRMGTSLSVVMLDLDHFKLVNDNFGHSEGDEVLREVGAVLSSHARNIDVVARYGGEEFMLVLPDTDCEKAVELASRLHDLLHGIQSQAGTITASMGISTFNGEPAASLHQIFEHADSALYHAKETGRNQTSVFQNIH